MSEVVCVNGVITSDGRVSMDDRGFTLGDGLFETIPLYKGAPHMLDRHLARLRDGAAAIGLAIPFDDGKVAESIAALSGENSVTRGVARLTVTRGEGPRGYGVKGCDTPLWVLTVRPYEPIPEDKWKMGWRLSPAKLKKDPLSVLCKLKSTSALERVITLEDAKKEGADEALALTVNGHVSSCVAANIFWVSEGTLYTPSTSCAILPGVTRSVVMELARKEGIDVEEGEYSPEALRGAEEVFTTNSLVEIMPVGQIAGIYGAGETPGPVTKLLSRKYRQSAAG